jgi:hypothetical protein
MSPLTHLLASWIVAAKTTDNPRDRRLVTLAGVAPDLDGWQNQIITPALLVLAVTMQ